MLPAHRRLLRGHPRSQGVLYALGQGVDEAEAVIARAGFQVRRPRAGGLQAAARAASLVGRLLPLP